MAEKIYPAAKPAGAGAAPAPASGGANPSFPANKAQLYNATRPVYRPQPRRSRRSCCCSICLFLTFIVFLLIFIAAIAGGIFYVLYRPHRPVFSVSSLQISQFSLTKSNQLNTKFNFTVAARNPNKKIVFYYDPVAVSMEANGVDVGDGTIPAFTTGKKNTTTLRTIVAASGQSVDDNSDLKSNLKNKKSLPLIIQLDTKVKVKIGSFKAKKVPVRVTCDGVKAAAPTGKSATVATTKDVKCKVDLRIKIWKWTI